MTLRNPRKPKGMTDAEFFAELEREARHAAITSGELVVPLPPGARLMRVGETVERGDLLKKYGWEPCKLVYGDTTIQTDQEAAQFATLRP